MRIVREEVAPGVFRLGLPYNAGFVNAYLVVADDGLRLIDTGERRSDSLEHMRIHLAEFGAELSDVRQLLLTHTHLDHAGLAAEMARNGTEVLLHPDEFPLADGAGLMRFRDDWLLRLGLDPADLPPWDMRVELPPPSQLTAVDGSAPIGFGSLLLEPVVTRGHSAALLCLYEPQLKVLFTGDQLMKVVTPIGMSVDDPVDPVGAYKEGLDAIAGLDVVTVLPGHGSAFSGYAEAIARARAAQEAETDAYALGLSAEPRTPWEVAVALGFDAAPSRQARELHATHVAIRVISHLRHLVARGRAVRVGDLYAAAGS